jgi:methionyl-tRNA synthetase
MWQAMLMSAGLPVSTQIFIHGFITANGQKMSKSVGNVVDPYEIVATYTTDATRYYLLHLPAYDDGDFSRDEMHRTYNDKLKNGVGNLTLRILSMIEKYTNGAITAREPDPFDVQAYWKRYTAALEAWRFNEALDTVDNLVSALDETISTQEPWAKVKNGQDVGPLMYQLAEGLRHVALMLVPIMPDTGKSILDQLGASTHEQFELLITWGGLEAGTTISKKAALFPELVEK